MSKRLHTEADRAFWLVQCISYTADVLDLPVADTARLLNDNNLIKPTLDGYKAFHTQGYEYMAEMLSDELRKAQGVTV